MTRVSGWTVAGILAAMLIGTIHAFAETQLAARRCTLTRLFPRGFFG